MEISKIKFEGFEELKEVLTEMQRDFGEQDQKKILTQAAKTSMQPVLTAARINLISHGNVDTGALVASLRLEARKPTSRDLKSQYVSNYDTVIATVTTASGAQLKKTKFVNVKTKKKQTGVTSDGRAIAIEFGTAKWRKGEGQPYMRPALESNSQVVLEGLARSFRVALERYKSKYTKGK